MTPKLTLEEGIQAKMGDRETGQDAAGARRGVWLAGAGRRGPAQQPQRRQGRGAGSSDLTLTPSETDPPETQSASRVAFACLQNQAGRGRGRGRGYHEGINEHPFGNGFIKI